MKDSSQKSKIISFLVYGIVIIGIIVTATVGLNFDLKYQEAKRIQLNIGKTFEISDIKQITKEVLGNQKVYIRKVEVYEDTVSILAKDITNEQKTEIVNKTNEKYGLELSADQIEITTIPRTRGRDIIKPYILPFAIATIVILVYMAIRYHKLGIAKTVAKALATLVLAQAFLLAIMAITRIPVGRITIPLVLATFVVTQVEMTVQCEKLLKQSKEEE
ncbi:MAG: hypothetical protein HFJ36_02605 [Clostridia bacterium]|nr:hypothetical protein [Clostridia bacterium]